MTLELKQLNCLTMAKSEKKPVIGILGGICSGKSSVASEFAKLGCGLIDCDEIAHKAIEKPEIKEEIIEHFGKDLLESSGKINRNKLADIVFDDSNKLTLLNKIVHPVVLEHVEQLIAQFDNRPDVKAIVLDMPLLAEIGWEKKCIKLVFVDCNEDLRLKRARKIGIYEKKQLKIRENFQISLDKKACLADNVINNNSDFSELVRQVAEVFTCVSNIG